LVRHLRTENDAREILDQFNGFHDGFIKQLSLRSHDSFEKHGPGETEITHRCTGTFDAVIQIAHYNYSGLQPLDRVIQCSFKGVREFCLDLRELMSYEWNIKSVDIQPAQRKSENHGAEGCFSLVLAWSKLVGDEWSEQKQQILTFTEAEFEEPD
jgi:hypothetical protein